MAAKQKLNPDDRIDGIGPLASRYSVSTKTVQNWIRLGLPKHGTKRKYQFYASQTDPWVEAYRTEPAAESASTQINLGIKEEQLKQNRVKTQQVEREEQAAQGNVLSREEMRLSTIEQIQLARDGLMGIPKELCRMVPKKYHRKLQEEGTNAVRRILTNYARGLQRLGADQ